MLCYPEGDDGAQIRTSRSRSTSWNSFGVTVSLISPSTGSNAIPS